MTSGFWRGCAQGANWWLQRNPTYLLSAACMAVGARLYLVHPRTRAGDIGVILLTLGVLQLYEWAVTAILLALHQRRRSPEDEPSLLLVATLFWTGPLAATRELAVSRPHLTMILTACVCAFALAELRTVRRLMSLRLGGASQLMAAGCIVLLAVAPQVLIIRQIPDGTNEIYLYFSYWLLAALAMAGLAVSRASAARSELHTEMAFLMITLGVTVAHMAAMNYAFFGHAQYFYASPLIIVCSAVLMDHLARRPARNAWPTWLAFVLPAVACLLAIGRFDRHMPIAALPLLVRDPLLPVLGLAGLAWWFGYHRLQRPAFLHAGSAALAWAACRAVVLLRPQLPAVHSAAPGMDWSREMAVLVLYAVMAYLLLLAWWRQSKFEVVAALVVHQVAFCLLLWGRTESDVLLLLLSGGWAWLIALKVAVPRPPLALTLWPIGLLAVSGWLYDFSDGLQWVARGNTLGMLLIVAAVGLMWPATRYRLVAGILVVTDAVFYSSRWLLSGENPLPMATVVGGFVLLAGGAVISWHKSRLLEVCCPETEEQEVFIGLPE